MTENTTDSVGVTAEPREQPFLYSWNRRIRHLHGVSLRNLNINPTAARRRSQVIAEDDYDLRTPAKLIAQNEANSLHQSRSFDNLIKADSPSKLKKASTAHENHGFTNKRPGMGKLRRRSTMHWGSANPRERQQKLQDVSLHRLVDTWFSIHHRLLDEPLYISELMEQSMNPSFSFFDLESGSMVTRDNTFQIKIWTKNANETDYKLLIDLNVNLRSLQFIGKSLDNFHHPLPPNCVLFHLTDGIYTSFTDLASDATIEPKLRPSQRVLPEVKMSSYDALMKLMNLDDCIQDALQTRQKLEADINNILAERKATSVIPSEIEAQEEKVKMAKLGHTMEGKRVAQSREATAKLRNSCDQRQKDMEEACRAQEAALELPASRQKEIEALRVNIESTSEAANGQIRRICEELLRIFPIEPIKNRTLQFTIRQIHLPNSVFDDTNRDEIAAALGFTGQLVHYLALYLSVPLPYPIDANGSSSFIQDPISISLAQRRFPLHPTNVNYKFEYGVFLLNKDIEFLMNRSGLRVLDIRHTLPNLKYLLYVLTAGNGELPSRKAGGVRGLWGGSITPSLSRRGSDDSVLTVSDAEYVNGTTITVGKEKDGIANDPLLRGRVKGLPYRKSLLREAA